MLEHGIARLALLALSERDVQRLLERAVVSIAGSLGAVHAQVFELLPDGATLLSRAAFGGERKALNRVKAREPADSQASFTLDANIPVISSNLRRETRFRPSRTQRALGVVTAVSVPLFGRGARPYGVLEVGWSGRPAVSPEDMADFLQSAGTLLAPAVERARVEAACRFLAESEVHLVSAHDFRGSVARLAEMAVPQLADWCCIDVVLPKGTIEPVGIAHSDTRLASRVHALRKRLRIDPAAEVGIAHVVHTGVAEFHLDLGAALSVPPGQEEVLTELTEAAGFRAAIVTPLAARGHLFGAITLVAQKARRLFDEGDVLLADAFASQAALALDNVRLFFGKGHEVPALPRIAGVTNGIALLDPEILGTQLLSALTEEEERLARVVDSVVLTSKLRTQQVEQVADTCDVVEVVRGAVESIRGSLPSAWSLEFEQPKIHSVGDAPTIRRIVTCLVDNAITYSPEGGSITVRLEADETSAKLSVEDEGIGIPPEELEQVFEKFFRGEGARAAGADGGGLGLYICRELAERLNGRLEVVADPERGATLFVELPLAAASPPPGDVLSLVPERAARPRRRQTPKR
ncbi:MAG: hypothetical protein A2Y55_12820 [Actinobacteria bacterium RBG_16_68_12]|nr:MAG: hypothetical protein A2Y55_12820 [Actinobacteria bacterium RBG_16_68_12]